mgnify:CR=1 FL=1
MINLLEYYSVVDTSQNSQLISVSVPLSLIGAGAGLQQITMFREILFTGIKKLFVMNMTFQARVNDNATGLLIPFQKSTCIATMQFPSTPWPQIDTATNFGAQQGFVLNENTQNDMMFGIQELSGTVGLVIDMNIFFSAVIVPNIDLRATIGVSGIAYRL